MLIRKPTLERIKSGEVDLAFRRWKRPTVKGGGTLKTAVGLLRIRRVEATTLRSISRADAQRAGYSELKALQRELSARDGRIYRIELAYDGEDPRIALRRDDELTADETEEVVRRLQRMDSRAPTGAWTTDVLTAIEASPMTRAAELAARLGFEKDQLKVRVRRLKNIGLTISHQTGYELSPRGSTILRALRERK